MPRTVFVTDGNERAALAITRSLGRREIDVIVGSERGRSLAGSSRYCHRQIRYPSPSADPKAFAEFLPQFLRSEDVDVVLPVTDITTRAVAGHTARIAPCKAAVPPLAAFEEVTDKRRLIARAAECGIPVPRTHVVNDERALPDMLDAISFPAVVKATRSRVPVGDQWLGTSVHYASDAADLLRLYREIPYLRQGTSLVQERVVGAGTGLFVLCDRGRLLTSFAHRRLREKPPSGGVSVLCESIPVDPGLRAEAERLLAPLGWHGVAMLEYKDDRRIGRPVLIEINGRFWGSLQLAVDAGVDFPYLTWQLALGQPPPVPDEYAVGVKTRWFFGDLDHLLSRLRKTGGNLPADAPSATAAVANFLKSSAPAVRGELLRPDDAWPAAREAREYLVTSAQALWKRMWRPVRPSVGAVNVTQALQGGTHADVRD